MPIVPILLWDASALVKRYSVELGREIVNAFFTISPRPGMVTSFWAYTETYAILVRKKNDGRIAATDFTAAVSALHKEVLAADDFELISIDDETALNSIPIIVKHNLNSADAAFLTSCLQYTREFHAGQTCVLLASDKRLIRAARSEGLAVLNPEAVVHADLPNVLATL